MSDIALHVNQTRAAGLLGASDAPAALGLDRYRSPLTLWRELRGEHVEDTTPEFVREAARWGQALEPIVRGRYALDRQVGVVVPVLSWVHEVEQWLRCTPDGFVMKAGTATVGVMDDERDRRSPGYVKGNSDGMLQVKTRSAFLRDEWMGGVPAKEEVQVRVEMAVCGLPWSDVACLIGGNHLVIHRVERDLELESNILRDLRAFWTLVQTGKEPPVDSSDAWRDYASSKMRPTKVTMQADEDVRELVEYWLEQRRKRKRYEEEEAAAKNDLLLKLSAAGATAIDLGGDRKVTAYKVGGRTDYKAWALELAGKNAKAPDKFKSEGKTWALRAPGDDE